MKWKAFNVASVALASRKTRAIGVTSGGARMVECGVGCTLSSR